MTSDEYTFCVLLVILAIAYLVSTVAYIRADRGWKEALDEWGDAIERNKTYLHKWGESMERERVLVELLRVLVELLNDVTKGEEE